MPRFKLTIEYDGAPYRGWQRQENGPSVQGSIETALGALEPGPHTVQGAGRTDAGVHATGQVAHVDLVRPWEPFRLAEALNHHLRPAPIVVLAAEAVSQDFHARFSAIYRRYHYTVINRRAPLALDAGLAWRVVQPLDIGAMRAGGKHLLGRHDFTTFRSAQCQARSPVKTLDEIEINHAGQMVVFMIAARSFLHNQVRSIVGTLVRAGSGAWTPEQVGEALSAADRAACGPVAPADGLVLSEVRYPVSPGDEK